VRRLATVFVFLAVVRPGAGATIASRKVHVEIQDDGYCVQEVLTIRLEEPGDLESWSEYVITMDPSTELQRCTAEVWNGQGTVVSRIHPRELRTLESPGTSMYSTSRMEIVPFPPLEVGQRLHLEVTTCSTPPYPVAVVPLQKDTPQEELAIAVDRAPRLRWKVTGAPGLVTMTQEEGTLLFRGSEIPAWDPPRLAPPSSLSRPALRLAWDGSGSWQRVGTWFSGLVASLPPPGPGIAARTREVCRGARSSRERVAAIASFVRHGIRYVAVEIGHGAWRPSPPDEVLERGWGDCKDKAALLRAMLESIGLRAEMVLIHAGKAGRFDETFPSPFWFNHTITAVDAAAAGARAGDPVVDGLLLIDPTVVHGGIGWLPPPLQDRPALYAAGEGSRLIEIPPAPSSETRSITVEGSVDGSGTLAGSIQIEIRGEDAVPWLVALDSSPQALIENRFARELRSELRGFSVRGLTLHEIPDEVPTVEVRARIERRGFARTRGDTHVMGVSKPGRLPARMEVPTGGGPVVVDCGQTTHRWILHLPDGWCLPAGRSEGVENAVGAVRAAVTWREDGALVIERTARLDSAWIPEERVPELLDLVRKGSRLFARRLRARCQSAAAVH